jgi:hypothetical protein
MEKHTIGYGLRSFVSRPIQWVSAKKNISFLQLGGGKIIWLARSHKRSFPPPQGNLSGLGGYFVNPCVIDIPCGA